MALNAVADDNLKARELQNYLNILKTQKTNFVMKEAARCRVIQDGILSDEFVYSLAFLVCPGELRELILTDYITTS